MAEIFPSSTKSSVDVNELEQLKQEDKRTSKEETPIWRRLPALIVFIFVGGLMVAIPIAIAQVVLIAVGNNVYQSLGFLLFNFFAINWCTLLFNLGNCWASSLFVLRISYLLIGTFAGLEAVWAWYYFGFVSGIIFAIFSFLVFSLLPKTATIFKMLTSQPYNASFATWLSLFRLWAVVAAPIVATYIRTGSATPISYFTVIFFSFPSTLFCANIRVDFCIHPESKTLDSLLSKIHWYRLVCRYVPIIGMILVFACFFLVTTSGLDRTDQDLTAFTIICGTLFMFFVCWYYLFGTYVDYSSPDSWSHRTFSSIVPWQDDILLKNLSSNRTD